MPEDNTPTPEGALRESGSTAPPKDLVRRTVWPESEYGTSNPVGETFRVIAEILGAPRHEPDHFDLDPWLASKLGAEGPTMT